jgi:hypothetical protein
MIKWIYRKIRPSAPFAVFTFFIILWVLFGILPGGCESEIAECLPDGESGTLIRAITKFKKAEFGPFEALMAALAFAGLILTLVMQQHELRLARAQTEEQTEIFNLQSFETSYYQAVDQFRTFHSEIATEIDPATQKIAELYQIGALLDNTQKPVREGSGIEILNGKVRAVVLAHLVVNFCDGVIEKLGDEDPVSPEDVEVGKHNHLRGKKLCDLEIALENEVKSPSDFENIGKTVIWYGGTLYPLIKRVRGILKILHAQPLQRRLQYIDFLQVELKPMEMGLIALCALHQAPYGKVKSANTPSFRELVRESGLLNDFPAGTAKLLRSMLSQDDWRTLVNKCGLSVATTEGIDAT